jgi:hypothetical protein
MLVQNESVKQAGLTFNVEGGRRKREKINKIISVAEEADWRGAPELAEYDWVAQV